MKSLPKASLGSILFVCLLFSLSHDPQTLGAVDESASSVPLKTHVDQQALISELEALVPKLMQQAEVPALSMAVIRDAEIIWHGSFGVKSNRTKEAVNDSTVFQAASLSKTIFAYLVFKMVGNGKLDLDTPLANYLTEDYIENDARVNKITARIVLSHTTGFPNWRPRDGELKIHFTPGEKFSYSGEGYVYLQKTIEHVTGKTLNVLMQERVFEPLGMRHSSFEWRDLFESNYAVGHAEFGVPIDRDPMTKGNAAFSLYTTARDYAKFLVAMMEGTGLKKESFRAMLTPQVRLDEDCSNCTNRKPSKLSDVNAWGLGWGLQTTEEGTSYWHWGDQGIFRCYTVAFEKQKIGLVYFTNSEGGLSIRNELVLAAIGGQHPAFAWMHYDAHDSPIKTFARAVVREGMDTAMKQYKSLKNDRMDGSPPLEERSVNSLGYQLMRMQKLDEAIAVFKLNVQDYPGSWNVYDSLAEAYMKNGDDELAIEYYGKSLELNPDNDNGRQMLEKLRAK